MSVFQLARATRSGQQQGSATITIPDSAKAILEYIVDPLVVVSFYSCKRPVQEALRSALHRQFDQESIESANIGIGGIWAFLSDNRKTGQQIDGIPTQLLTPSSPRYLYLIPASTATAGGGQGQDSSLSFPDDDTVDLVGRILVGLMAVASTQLVVISENLQDAQDDLKVIGPAIELVVERATDVEPLLATYGHPTLSWRMGYDPSIADSSTAGSRTIAIQRLLSNQGNNSDNIRNLDVINRFFTLQDQAARSGYCESHTTPDMDMENMLTGGLQVLSINRDSTGQGKGTVLSEKDHGLHKSSLIPWIENTLSSVEGLLTTGDQFVNGLLLYANLQVSLTQLETIITFASSDPSSTYIDHSLLQQPQLHRQTLLSERILLNAGLTYHRVMNEYLDAMPIPLPSHTLAMIHSKAESAALSVAEVQCMGLSVDFDLKQLLLPKLRDMCLVADQQTTLAARTTAVTTVADAITISMEPTSGMYMEYWTANVLALKSYHSNLLDELWQATFSEEALDALDEEEGVAAETATAQDPLDRAGYLKVSRGVMSDNR
ncbi:hypothetical protein BGZ83_008775 [Gryganskiella cystojenkinii]|nr:hypothetical protein BGZ83_008775 [Gryganskiella cystojenkinii]